MRRHALHVLAALAALALLIPTAAFASPGSGVVNIATRSDGTLAGPTKVNIVDVIKLQTHRDIRVLTQELTILPGGNTGWHSHPGPVLVTVKSGVFRYQESDCSFVDYSAGETVLDPGGGHVHIGRNPSQQDNLDLSVTYLIPLGEAPRIDVPAVAC
jgi:quercetin dioxygenase-like cupin family protein